jgi:hypothetical protein
VSHFRSAKGLCKETEVRSQVFILCGVVTVTFRVLSLFVVTKWYSYSKIVLQLTVVPPAEYPINRLTDPNPCLKSLIHVTICCAPYVYSYISSIFIRFYYRDIFVIFNTRKLVNWDFGLCPSSGILKNIKEHNVSETRSVCVLRWGSGRRLLRWTRYELTSVTCVTTWSIWRLLLMKLITTNIRSFCILRITWPHNTVCL